MRLKNRHEGPSGAIQAVDGRWVSSDWKWWWDGQQWQPLNTADRVGLEEFARSTPAAKEYDSALAALDEENGSTLVDLVSAGLELSSANLQFLESAMDQLVIDFAAGQSTDFVIGQIQRYKGDIFDIRDCLDETARLAAEPLSRMLDDDEAETPS